MRRSGALRTDERLRRALDWIFSLRGSPEAIAGGVAIGILVALSPTVGVQCALAALLATLCNANRPAAVMLVWLTNPVTIPPVFAATYAIGAWLLPGGPAFHPSAVAGGALAVVSGVAAELLVRMVVGGLLLGALLATVAYAATLRLVRAYRRAQTSHVQTSRTSGCGRYPI